MRQIWVIFLLLGFIACQSAEDAEPGNAETFIKLIGGESQDAERKFLVVEGAEGKDNGIIILGTIENEQLNSFRIRLTRLDNKGNTIWERKYPEKDTTEFSYRAGSLVAIDDGYFIVGDSIKNEIEAEDGEEEIESRAGLLILKVDLDGNLIDNMTRTQTLEDAELRARDITINQNGNLVVISEIISDEKEAEVFITEYDINNLDTLCGAGYTTEINSVAPSLLIAPDGDYVFGGTGNVQNQRIRILKIPPGCGPIPDDSPFLLPGSTNNYVINQIIPTINGFAIVGTTDEGSVKTDIFIARLNPRGELEGDVVIYNELEGKPAIDEEEGLTIANTSDGGFIISGSTRSNTGAGETNIVLIKVDVSGNVQWTRQFGDLNEEEGSLVREAPNGGYYILGNSEFGGLDTIIIIRTDSEGNVE